MRNTEVFFRLFGQAVGAARAKTFPAIYLAPQARKRTAGSGAAVDYSAGAG